MRLILVLTLFPVLSMAECQIELEEIKPRVNRTLQPLYEKENSAITENDFTQAEAQVSELIAQIDACADYHHKYELENFDYTRWGEKSEKYRSYSLRLTSVDMQLEAAVESFKFWILRPWFFDVDMWEKAALEFDAWEI